MADDSPPSLKLLLERLTDGCAAPARVRQYLEAQQPELDELLPHACAVGLRGLVAVLAGSSAASGLLLHQPALLYALVTDAALGEPLSTDLLEAAIVGARPAAPTPARAGSGWLVALGLDHPPVTLDAWLGHLRSVRMALWLRAVARELAGLAPATTGAELSALAEHILRQLWQLLRTDDERAFGPWADDGGEVGLVLLGQGKLGAYDLNVSSDIDVQVLALRRDAAGIEQPLGEVQGRLESFVRRFVAVVSEHGEGGWLYRVDLDLRPFGRSGALVQSIHAAETYYETLGAPWERMALVRARPVAGDSHVATHFLTRTCAFIYPRIRSAPFVAQIREQRRRGTPSPRTQRIDVKRARGGIRDIELFVQVHQVLLGGHHQPLQSVCLLPAIAALQASGALMLQEAALLRRSYLLLRRIENTLQAHEEVQLHQLPPAGPELERLNAVLRARGRQDACGAADGAALLRRVRRVLGQVGRLVARLDDAGEAVLALREHAPRRRRALRAALGSDAHRAAAALMGLGFVQAPGPLPQVRQLQDLIEASRLAPQARANLVVAIVDELSQTPDPALGLRHVLGILPALSHHRGYMQLLAQTPQLRRRLLDLLGTSAWLGRMLIVHPELIDLLAQAPSGLGRVSQLGRADLRQALWARLTPIVSPPLRWAALRAFVREQTLMVSLGYLAHTLTPVMTLQALGRMTEAALEVALQLCQPPTSPPGQGLSVLALGRLGTGQRAFGSDIDLVFVSGTSDAERLAAQTLWVQRALAKIADAPLPLPIHIDLRLRPYGSEGPLVTTCAGLVRYFQHDARLWERQAYLKAKAVALDVAVGERALGIVQPLLFAPKLTETDIDEARRVRQAMKRAAQGAQGHKPALIDLKAGPGGLADIELGTQLLQLLFGHAHPSVRIGTTFDALEALGALALPLQPTPQSTARSWTMLRAIELSWRMGEGSHDTAVPRDGPQLVALALRLGYSRPHPAKRLLRDLARHQRRGAQFFAAAVRLARKLSQDAAPTSSPAEPAAHGPPR